MPYNASEALGRIGYDVMTSELVSEQVNTIDGRHSLTLG